MAKCDIILNMQKTPLIIIIGSVTLLVGFIVGYSLFSNQNSSPIPTMATSPLNQEVASPSAQDIAGTFEYFWGNTCPHCKNVADFLETWALKDKIKITKMEVYENKDNAKIIVERAVVCKIPKDQIPVPFLVTPSGKCLLGDQPIIEYFKKITL